MRSRLVQTIIKTLEPVACNHGYELVDVEVAGTTRTPLLRVFLDKATGLGIDDIAAANSWVDACIDELDLFRGSFTLELSSPGIDRPLRTLEHFERFAGQTACIVMASKKEDALGQPPAEQPEAGQPLGQPPAEQDGGRLKWTGRLAGVEDKTENKAVLIEIDGVIRRLDYANIRKAHLKGTIDFGQNSKTSNETQKRPEATQVE